MAPTRGGRGGGAAGGRGGFRGGSGKISIGGIETSWDYDPNMKLEGKPSETYPPDHQPSIAKQPSEREMQEVNYFRTFRADIHRGPLYAVIGNNVRVGKRGAESVTNPFDALPSWSEKYRMPKRRLPKLDSRPYVLKFFPEELWSVLDPHHDSTDPKSLALKAKQRKSLFVPAKKKSIFDKLDKAEAEGEGVDIDELDEEEKEEDKYGEDFEEVRDDDFEDDEDEDDDYNAEKYFSGGEDDDAGDEGDGGYDEI